MKVYVADQAGFCFGVKRALDIIERLHEEGKDTCIYGELIHNRTVLDELKAKGIDCLESLDNLPPHKTVVIRTHGIPRDVESDLQSRKENGELDYIDATCPLVKKLQNIIEERANGNARIVIAGDPNHPEIIAAKSYAAKSKFEPMIIGSEDDALRLENEESIDLVAQTTLDTEFFDKIVSILNAKTKQLNVYNTICKATRVRQDAIRKLAPEVDFVVVVGGKNSSNTQKLYRIASKHNKNTFLIENSKELNETDFIRKVGQFKTVGITAGASTPPEEIEKIKKIFISLV